MKDLDMILYNKKAWDQASAKGSPWAQPVSSQAISEAKQGNWKVHLTTKPLPAHWLPPTLLDKKILCLASGGGQQAPILAAAGADVTVFDFSEKQLDLDRMVSERDDLNIRCVQGDMRDLSCFDTEYFDLIFHPISNLYVPELHAVWKGCNQVLKKGGVLLSSFYNPVAFVFGKGLEVKYKIPFSSVRDLSPRDLQNLKNKQEAYTFAHSLSDQIAGQLHAGFLLEDFYEDHHPHKLFPIDEYIPVFLASKAIKK